MDKPKVVTHHRGYELDPRDRDNAEDRWTKYSHCRYYAFAGWADLKDDTVSLNNFMGHDDATSAWKEFAMSRTTGDCTHFVMIDTKTGEQFELTTTTPRGWIDGVHIKDSDAGPYEDPFTVALIHAGLTW